MLCKADLDFDLLRGKNDAIDHGRVSRRHLKPDSNVYKP